MAGNCHNVGDDYDDSNACPNWDKGISSFETYESGWPFWQTHCATFGSFREQLQTSDGKDILSLNLASTAMDWSGQCLKGKCNICYENSMRCGSGWKGVSQVCLQGKVSSPEHQLSSGMAHSGFEV